jgi:hypothetical protein
VGCRNRHILIWESQVSYSVKLATFCWLSNTPSSGFTTLHNYSSKSTSQSVCNKHLTKARLEDSGSLVKRAKSGLRARFILMPHRSQVNQFLRTATAQFVLKECALSLHVGLLAHAWPPRWQRRRGTASELSVKRSVLRRTKRKSRRVGRLEMGQVSLNRATSGDTFCRHYVSLRT